MLTARFHSISWLLIFVLIFILAPFISLIAQESSDQVVKTEYKPGFYTSFALIGYQAREVSYDFSTINYRTSATGMMLSYTSRFWGLNLNIGRALSFREFILNPNAVVLVNWVEAGINVPIIRKWSGTGFFSKYSVLLTANTSLFKRLYVQTDRKENFASSNYIHDSFPQIYDFGLEFRRNLLSFKLGYLKQLQEYNPQKPEFLKVPDDISGSYFEMAVSLGFWSKRQETRILKQKEKIIEEAPPNMNIKIQFSEPSGNRKLDGGESGSLKIDLKNSGRGIAKGIEIRTRFISERNENLSFPKIFKVNELAPESETSIEIPIAANAEILDDRMELEVEVNGKNFSSIMKEISFDTQEYDATDEPLRTNMDNSEAIAVVIGIRNYQKSQIPTVEYAENDAKVMREYLIKTLGFKSNNILPRDPNEIMTAGNLKTLIRRILPGYIRDGVSDVFFFYAGHGAPNPNTNEAFLVPYDCDPNYVTVDNAYRLRDLYFDLAKIKARHITVVIDACFSGYGGDGKAIVKNISPVNIRVENPLLSNPNVTIFASSQVDQVSNWYPDKRHGLFSYFFLRGLRGKADLNGDRRITVGELRDYLRDTRSGVPYLSNREFQRLQEPVVSDTDFERVIVSY